MNYIAFDLELEQPKTNPQASDSLLDEEQIIQIGWCVYSVNPFTIIDTNKQYINIGVPLSKFITKLTKITNSDLKLYGINLNEAYNLLVSDMKSYKTARGLIQWGGADQDCLRKELPEDINWQFGYSGVNIKHVFQIWARANNINPSGGLSKSLNKCGLKWDGGHKHDALNDAINTARMHDFLYRKLTRKGENE
jgi:inhibitor of KinA sporulation pathway (predicted exonuclease)